MITSTYDADDLVVLQGDVLPVATPACFMQGCDEPPTIIRSWYEGPTFGACAIHEQALRKLRSPELVTRAAGQRRLL